MELKSHSFTSKEPHVARQPQVADPWPRRTKRSYTVKVAPANKIIIAAQQDAQLQY
jgi:hypothetical protein